MFLMFFTPGNLEQFLSSYCCHTTNGQTQSSPPLGWPTNNYKAKYFFIHFLRWKVAMVRPHIGPRDWIRYKFSISHHCSVRSCPFSCFNRRAAWQQLGPQLPARHCHRHCSFVSPPLIGHQHWRFSISANKTDRQNVDIFYSFFARKLFVFSNDILPWWYFWMLQKNST